MPFRADRAAGGMIGACLILLAGCAETTPQANGSRAPRSSVAVDLPVRVGQPYQAGGRTWTPADDRSYDEVGLASVYGAHEGGRTASGEPFRPGAITAAHTTLPLPSYVEVTALDSGRTILVRINDRGPFARGRILDLSPRAAQLLGHEGGVLRVRVRRAFPPESDRAALRNGQQAAARLPTSPQLLAALNARLDGTLGQRLRPIPSPGRTDATPNPASTAEEIATATPEDVPPLALSPHIAPMPVRPLPGLRAQAPSASGLFVQLGAFAAQGRAEAAARAAGGQASFGNGMWRARLGPFADRVAATQALARARARGYPDAALVRDPASP